MSDVIVLSPHACWYEKEPQLQPSAAERIAAGIILSMVPPALTAYARRPPYPDNVASAEGGGIGAMDRMQARVVYRAERAMENFSFRFFQITELLMGLFALGSMAVEAMAAAPVAGRVAVGGVRATASGAGGAVRSAAPEIVEIGAGDLRASMRITEAGARVIAVDTANPPREVLEALQRAGGRFIKGTAATLPAHSADQVVVYFPWRIGGAGSYIQGFTWEAIPQTTRLVRQGGLITFVTEDPATASFLAREAARIPGARVAQISSTARQAAPGATGVGVPNMNPQLEVKMVNIYLR